MARSKNRKQRRASAVRRNGNARNFVEAIDVVSEDEVVEGLVVEPSREQVVTIDLNNIGVNHGVVSNGALEDENQVSNDDPGNVSNIEFDEENDEEEEEVHRQVVSQYQSEHSMDSVEFIEYDKPDDTQEDDVLHESFSALQLGENDETVDANNSDALTSTSDLKPKKRGTGFTRTKKNNNQLTWQSGSVKGLRYTLESMFDEPQHFKSIYCTAFNTVIVKWMRSANKPTQDLFATCGDQVCTLYSYDERTRKFVPHSTYRDDDDVYHSCCFTWSQITGNQLLIYAGKRGLIQVVDIATQTNIQTFRSHAVAVNDLKVPLWSYGNWCPNLLLSASNDQSIKLWNTKNGLLVAKFAGSEGHRAEVLSVDFHPAELFFVSCGADRSIRIWSLQRTELLAAIFVSDDIKPYDPLGRAKFRTRIEEVPVFVTRAIHEHMVDCVAWIKDCLISRSCMENISIFRPGKTLTAPLSDLKPHFKNLRYNSTDTSSDEIEWNKQQAERNAEIKQKNGGESATNEVKVDSDNRKTRLQFPPLYEMVRIQVPNTSCWFLRFGMDYRRQFLGQGDMLGNVLLWDLRQKDRFKWKPIKIPASPDTYSLIVRQVAFNFDGNKMVAVTDQCKVLVYDLAGVEKVDFQKMPKPRASPSMEPENDLNPFYQKGKDRREFWLNKLNPNLLDRPVEAVPVTRYRDAYMEAQSIASVLSARPTREVNRQKSIGEASTSTVSNRVSKAPSCTVSNSRNAPVVPSRKTSSSYNSTKTVRNGRHSVGANISIGSGSRAFKPPSKHSPINQPGTSSNAFFVIHKPGSSSLGTSAGPGPIPLLVGHQSATNVKVPTADLFTPSLPNSSSSMKTNKTSVCPAVCSKARQSMSYLVVKQTPTSSSIQPNNYQQTSIGSGPISLPVGRNSATNVAVSASNTSTPSLSCSSSSMKMHKTFVGPANRVIRHSSTNTCVKHLHTNSSIQPDSLGTEENPIDVDIDMDPVPNATTTNTSSTVSLDSEPDLEILSSSVPVVSNTNNSTTSNQAPTVQQIMTLITPTSATIHNVPDQSVSLGSAINPIVVDSPKKPSNVVPQVGLARNTMITDRSTRTGSNTTQVMRGSTCKRVPQLGQRSSGITRTTTQVTARQAIPPTTKPQQSNPSQTSQGLPSSMVTTAQQIKGAPIGTNPTQVIRDSSTCQRSIQRGHGNSDATKTTTQVNARQANPPTTKPQQSNLSQTTKGLARNSTTCQRTIQRRQVNSGITATQVNARQANPPTTKPLQSNSSQTRQNLAHSSMVTTAQPARGAPIGSNPTQVIRGSNTCQLQGKSGQTKTTAPVTARQAIPPTTKPQQANPSQTSQNLARNSKVTTAQPTKGAPIGSNPTQVIRGSTCQRSTQRVQVSSDILPTTTQVTARQVIPSTTKPQQSNPSQVNPNTQAKHGQTKFPSTK